MPARMRKGDYASLHFLNHCKINVFQVSIRPFGILSHITWILLDWIDSSVTWLYIFSVKADLYAYVQIPQHFLMYRHILLLQLRDLLIVFLFCDIFCNASKKQTDTALFSIKMHKNIVYNVNKWICDESSHKKY